MSLENLVPWRRNRPTSTDVFANEHLSSISSLQREMNRMFNTIWPGPTAMAATLSGHDEPRAFIYPSVEMSETERQIEVIVEIPGVSEKDIELTLSSDGKLLSIRGEKKLIKEKQKKDYYCTERNYGIFRRTLSLPCEVRQENIEANFHNGVLQVKLTKVESTDRGTQHIAIKSV